MSGPGHDCESRGDSARAANARRRRNVPLSPFFASAFASSGRIKRGYYSFLILAVRLRDLVFSAAAHQQQRVGGAIRRQLVFSRCSITTRRRPSASRAIGEPDYRALAQAFRQENKGNWVLMPPYPYSPTESLLDLPGSPPNPPSRQHIFGTDDRGRDIFARLAYGFNVSLSFALLVLVISLAIGRIGRSGCWDISAASWIFWASA